MRTTYAVTYRDFTESMRQYRRRTKWPRFVYLLDVWFLPSTGVSMVCLNLYGRLTHNPTLTDLTNYLAIIGLLAAVGLPLLYQFRLRNVYAQRTSLSDAGRVELTADETHIVFEVNGKVNVSYEWNAFSDCAESQQVMTLFVNAAALHTIPLYGLTAEDAQQLRTLVTTHVRKH